MSFPRKHTWQNRAAPTPTKRRARPAWHNYLQHAPGFSAGDAGQSLCLGTRLESHTGSGPAPFPSWIPLQSDSISYPPSFSFNTAFMDDYLHRDKVHPYLLSIFMVAANSTDFSGFELRWGDSRPLPWTNVTQILRKVCKGSWRAGFPTGHHQHGAPREQHLPQMQCESNDLTSSTTRNLPRRRREVN